MRAAARVALLAVLPFAATAAAGATRVESYELRLTLSADGSGRAAATVHLVGCTAGSLLLPLGLPGANDLRLLDAPPGTAVDVVPAGGQANLRISLPEGVPESASLRVELPVAGLLVRQAAASESDGSTAMLDRWTLRHALLATQPESIDRYRVEVVFPPGMRAHALRDALPRLRKGESLPRAGLTAIDGHPGAQLAVDRLVQGETAALQLELVRSERSPAWWIVGLVLSVVYLVRFRDLVAKSAS